jgi:hypothetical protein
MLQGTGNTEKILVSGSTSDLYKLDNKKTTLERTSLRLREEARILIRT